MLEEGPEIARRADRVGVPPLAPIVRKRPQTDTQEPQFYHSWAHCVLRSLHKYTVGPDAKTEVKLVQTQVPIASEWPKLLPNVPTMGPTGSKSGFV